jgi:hypothetical protein
VNCGGLSHELRWKEPQRSSTALCSMPEHASSEGSRMCPPSLEAQAQAKMVPDACPRSLTARLPTTPQFEKNPPHGSAKESRYKWRAPVAAKHEGRGPLEHWRLLMAHDVCRTTPDPLRKVVLSCGHVLQSTVRSSVRLTTCAGAATIARANVVRF